MKLAAEVKTRKTASCQAYGGHLPQGSARAVAYVIFQGPALKFGSCSKSLKRSSPRIMRGLPPNCKSAGAEGPVTVKSATLVLHLARHPGIMLLYGESGLSECLVQEISAEERMLEDFGKFLETVPFSAAKPGFAYSDRSSGGRAGVTDLEQDLRAVPLDAGGIIDITRDYLHRHFCLRSALHWDLWAFNAEGRWRSSRNLWKYPVMAKSMTKDSGKRAGISRWTSDSSISLPGMRACSE